MKENSKLHMQQQLLCFNVFSYKIIPNGYNLYTDGYVTFQAFQRDLIHSIWTSNDLSYDIRKKNRACCE